MKTCGVLPPVDRHRVAGVSEKPPAAASAAAATAAAATAATASIIRVKEDRQIFSTAV